MARSLYRSIPNYKQRKEAVAYGNNWKNKWKREDKSIKVHEIKREA